MVVSMPAKQTDIRTTNAIPSVGRWLIGHPPCCALRHSPWERLKKQSRSPDAIRVCRWRRPSPGFHPGYRLDFEKTARRLMNAWLVRSHGPMDAVAQRLPHGRELRGQLRQRAEVGVALFGAVEVCAARGEKTEFDRHV